MAPKNMAVCGHVSLEGGGISIRLAPAEAAGAPGAPPPAEVAVPSYQEIMAFVQDGTLEVHPGRIPLAKRTIIVAIVNIQREFLGSKGWGGWWSAEAWRRFQVWLSGPKRQRCALQPSTPSGALGLLALAPPQPSVAPGLLALPAFPPEADQGIDLDKDEDEEEKTGSDEDESDESDEDESDESDEDEEEQAENDEDEHAEGYVDNEDEQPDRPLCVANFQWNGADWEDLEAALVVLCSQRNMQNLENVEAWNQAVKALNRLYEGQ
jgi:hypothetical protein